MSRVNACKPTYFRERSTFETFAIKKKSEYENYNSDIYLSNFIKEFENYKIKSLRIGIEN